MIRLLEGSSAIPLDDLVDFCLESHRLDRRLVMLNMVVSLDGATAVRGRSGPLSDSDDQALFQAFRAASDVILVGAGTVRAEDYGPVRLTEAARRARERRGLSPIPEMAVVSASLRLEPTARLFSDPAQRPLVFTARAAVPRADTLGDRARVVPMGREEANLAEVIEHLLELGHRTILCEGGPTLNSGLIGAGLVDELDLALSPVIVGGSSFPLVAETPPVPLGFRLERVMSGDRMLFLRYLREERSHLQA
ncbi:MAG TPA: pyrimidine reductase family protein [Acidimicrobiia bacterium]|jgi:riboflavin-specific deaminase-like protein|nr:pyrimidine reductase family protein [Acidimicrobiia bacterium]